MIRAAPMHVLAFDCSGTSCGAAVVIGDRVASERHEWMARGQAAALLPMIRAVMGETGIGFDALDAIVTTRGPGSFTGIRLGLAAAQGLTLATGIKAVAVTAFEAVLTSHRGSDDAGAFAYTVVAIDSRRGPIFAQAFDPAGHALADPTALAPESAESWLPDGPTEIIGEGTKLLRGRIGRPDVHLSADDGTIRAAAIGLSIAGSAGLGPDDRSLRPLYLRPPDVTVPRGGAKTGDHD